MTLMICPKADKCLRVCEAKFEHERSHFCEEECGAGYIAPCNIILEKPVDVTLQDFYSFVNKRTLFKRNTFIFPPGKPPQAQNRL